MTDIPKAPWLKSPDEIVIDDLRHDVQKLHYLKEFARSATDHIGVFTKMREQTIDDALKRKATFIMGGPTLNDRIQQDKKYYDRFVKHPHVNLYDERGNRKTLIGLIGHIDDTQIIIHPVGESWVHPLVAHDFKDWDLVYAYPLPGVARDTVELYPPHLQAKRHKRPE